MWWYKSSRSRKSFSVKGAKQSASDVYVCMKCGITSSLTFFFSLAESSSSLCSTLTLVYNNDQKRNENVKLTAVDCWKSLPFMVLESTASHSLVSSSSSKLSNSSSSTILVFFESFVAALGLDIKVGPSKCAATTSFKVVVRCYIPIFYFKLHPKFPFIFHTPMFLMFQMSSYSILWCFWCFLMFSILRHFPIPHSDVSNISCSLLTSFCTPMFPLLQHFRNPPVPFHAPMFSDVFPIFIDAEPFQSYYGLIIIMEPFW